VEGSLCSPSTFAKCVLIGEPYKYKIGTLKREPPIFSLTVRHW
jgi:hypothetical protein